VTLKRLPVGPMSFRAKEIEMLYDSRVSMADGKRPRSHEGHDAMTDADAALRLKQERLLDEGLEETFPASDPVAVMRLT
jgi:hypothetical protein